MFTIITVNDVQKEVVEVEQEETKKRIIKVTTQLIEQYNGDLDQITSRLIAEKAGIGLGSINYYFKSKAGLIALCVQQIIGGVIAQLDLNEAFQTDEQRLCAWANGVFEFLFAHPAIARVSILGDLQNYTGGCNAVRTQQGFALALAGVQPPQERALLAFILASAMQVAFLGGDTIHTLLGYDFKSKAGRAAYINKTVSVLLAGRKA